MKVDRKAAALAAAAGLVSILLVATRTKGAPPKAQAAPTPGPSGLTETTGISLACSTST